MVGIEHLTPSDPEYWSVARKEEKREWPEEDPPPIHTSRDPWPSGVPVPAAVKKLQVLLISEGFGVKLTYARGFMRAVKIGTYVEVESIAVRFEGYGRIGYAIYRRPIEKQTWTWVSIGLSRIDSFPFQLASRTDLEEWVMVHGDVLPSWYNAIVARISNQKARQKEAAKTRGTKPRESSG